MDKQEHSELVNYLIGKEVSDSNSNSNLKMKKSISKVSMNRPVIPNMGCHLVCDFVNIDPDNIDLDNMEVMDQFLSHVIISSKATIEGKLEKKFDPQGLSILYLLSESHFSIHTWPESNACAIDFYHCGDDAYERMKIAEELLCDRFGWKNCTSSLLVKRGTISKYLLNDYEETGTIFKNIHLKHREKTKYQDLRVFESEKYGKIMTSDDQVILTEDKEYDYLSEMIKQTISKDRKCENLLMIGGGDLELCEYLVQRYPKVKKVTLVDIDKDLFKVKKRFFNISATMIQALQDQKVKIVNEDCEQFIEKYMDSEEQKFDGILIDCYDVDNVSSTFSSSFYRTIYDILENGCKVTQFLGNKEFKTEFDQNVRKAGFNEISYNYSYIPVYSSCVPIGSCVKS